ncbi:MAG: TRAP transporter permease, partial [Clostridiales bacterium]|nr:TRAP transporter permease [Clostridiales bacterium]
MPTEILYILVLLATICIVFIPLKRPIYEAMFAGYVVMILITGQWANFFTYIWATTTNTLFYAIIAFLAVAQIFGGTKVIDTCIEVILSIFGRIRGGAGYVALISSTFMGALSGSGAGNVAATGVFTIPAMKKSGFPAHLAANVESASSTMGNMIPPAGVITAAFGCVEALYPGQYTMSMFWILMWGISVWFIIQRAITLYLFCRYYKVERMAKEDIPKLSNAVRNGWKALLLPLVIFLPFFLDNLLSPTVFKAQIAGGASSVTSSVLLFTPGLAAIYACLIVFKKVDVRPKAIVAMFSQQIKSIVPVTATIFFAYCISSLFGTINLGEAVGTYISSLGLNLVALAILIPLFCA